MTVLFSLAYLSAMSLNPPEALAVAARTGYHGVGLRLLPSAPGGPVQPLLSDAGLRRDTLAALRDTGQKVFDIEIIRLDAAFRLADFDAFMALGAELGARAVLVAGDDPEPARLAEHFARLCEALQPYGLSADLEFMPWTTVRCARDAARVVRDAGTPANAGVLVDALHFARSDSSLADVAALPREWLHYAQMCDAPHSAAALSEAQMIHDARCERLLPGEGAIDLKGLWAQLPAGLPISLEVPNIPRVTALGAEAWARLAIHAAHAVLAQPG
jgi:sugar phosphate isomerase/epimerase